MDLDKNWKYGKIVEENGTGLMILHQNNLQSVIDTWSKIEKKEDPITIVSFIGPQSCGKSFFSNIYIEYIRMYGSLSWTKRIKREGLKGFSYGVEPNVITDGQLIPEKNINAVYIYPKLVKLNADQREEYVCILHVHRGDRKSRNEEAGIALDVLLAMMSSILVNIMWNDKNKLSDINDLITDPRFVSIKDHLTGNIINLLRGDGVRENEKVIQLEESPSLHDNTGKVRLSYQQYSAVNNLMKAISVRQNVKHFKLSNILEHFKNIVKIVNACNGFSTTSPSSFPNPIEVKAHKHETKSIDEYKLENQKLAKIQNEFGQENIRMPKEIEDKIKRFFSSQFSEQINPEIDHWVNNHLINQNFIPNQNDFGSHLQYFNEQNIARLFSDAKEEFQKNQKLINEEIMECMQNFFMIMNTRFEDEHHFSGNALRKALNNTLTLVTSELKFSESKERILKASRNMFRFYYEQNKVQKSAVTHFEVPDAAKNTPVFDDEFLGDKSGKTKVKLDPFWFGEESNSAKNVGETKWNATEFRMKQPQNTSKLTSIPTPTMIEIDQALDLLFKHPPNKKEPHPTTTTSAVDGILKQNKHRNQEPLFKNTKRELPPLLYQITLSKVITATLPKTSWENNSLPTSIHSHPGEVGILMDEKWVCGNDVKELNERGKMKKFWSFEVLFNTYDFSDTVVINREEICITLPLLLGVFFRIMKHKAEKEQSGTISSAMIGVPFWFSSYKRTHIIEAGTIAGFDNIQLVNESTASAYFSYRNALSSPTQSMIVISENSNRMDVSIYSYDQQSKIIYMRGQSGDYETTELSKQKGFAAKFVTGTLKYLYSNQQEKALESLDKLWGLAKSRVQSRLNLNNNTVLICCESNFCREFLWQFAAKITSSENILVRNDSPLLGLASFFQVAKIICSVDSLFWDAIPFNLILAHESLPRLVEIKNRTFSNSAINEFNFELPKSVGYSHFSENDLSPQTYGKFNLKFKPPHSFKIKVTLKRNKNGIFILTGVDYTEGISYDWGGPTKPLPDHYFEWQPCKTIDETLAVYRSLVNKINPQTETKISSKVEEILMQTATEEKVKKIKEAIQACTDKFKSSIGKNMVIRQIDDILEALKQPGIQGKQLKKHMAYLDSIVQKYDLQI